MMRLWEIILEGLSKIDSEGWGNIVNTAVSTITGTFLGWFLGRLSHRGKLNIYVCSCSDSFQSSREFCFAEGVYSPATSIEDTHSWICCTTLQVYNSSDETKIMRNLQFALKGNIFKVKVLNAEDTDTPLPPFPGCSRSRYDKVGLVNIPPKSAIELNLRCGTSSSEVLQHLWKAKKIMLRYNNEKNIKRSILLKKGKYSEAFAKKRG